MRGRVEPECDAGCGGASAPPAVRSPGGGLGAILEKTKNWDALCGHLMKLKKPEILTICGKKVPSMGEADLRHGKTTLLERLKPE